MADQLSSNLDDALENPGVPGSNHTDSEQGRLTRRAALRKIGVTAGLSAFAMFSVDDLARMVGNALQQRASDNKTVSEIAKSFQQSGVANAAGATPMATAGPCTSFATTGNPNDCYECNNERLAYCNNKCPASQCAGAANAGSFTCGTPGVTYANLQSNWSSICRTCLANCY